MKLSSHEDGVSEFLTRRPENYLRVENKQNGVVIRMIQNNFTPARMSAFVRYLAAEGFIPEHYRWFSDPDSGSGLSVRWVHDSSWAERECQAAQKQSDRICMKILVPLLVLSIVLICWILYANL
jgi:hypothetical protein